MGLHNIQGCRSIILVVLLPSVVFLLLLSFEIREPNYFLYDDNADLFFPAYFYNWHALIDHKTLPLINFHQFLGHTFLGQGQTGVLYLPVYISAFLSKIITGNIFNTIDILAFIHLGTSCVGMFLLLRRFQLSPVVCFLSSLMWITLPFITIISRSWIFTSYTATFLPFNFLLLDKLTDEPRMRNALYLAVLKSAFFYAGYIQYVFIMIVLEIIYILLLLSHRLYAVFRESMGRFKSRFNSILYSKKEYFKEVIKLYVSSTFFFLCLSAPLFLPMFFVQQESALRTTKVPFLNFIGNSVELIYFIKAQFFNFEPNVIFGTDSEIYYFGFFNLLILPLVMIKRFRRNFKIAAFVLLAGIALLFSTEFYKIFYNVPGFNLFRWPVKYFLFFLFFATIGVAGITDVLIKQNKKWIKAGIYLLLCLAVGLNCLVLWLNSGPSDVLSSKRIGNPPINNLEKHISKNAGRIFTFWVYKSDSREFYKYFTFNFATVFDYFHLGGYDILVSRQNSTLSLGLNFFNTWEGMISQALLDDLSSKSVRYLVTKDKIHTRIMMKDFDQLKLKYRGNDILMYENTLSLPLVYYHDNKLDPLEFDFGINEINVYPNNSSARTIIINVTPLRWFKIYINGIDAGRINQNEFPIKINIPPNTKQLKLKYVDYPFYLGVLILILFVAVIVVFLIISAFNKLKA